MKPAPRRGRVAIAIGWAIHPNGMAGQRAVHARDHTERNAMPPSKRASGKFALVCGAGGFIGHHLVRYLKGKGFWGRGADLNLPLFSETEADDFIIGDLRDPYFVRYAIDLRFDEIYQLAADVHWEPAIFSQAHTMPK
jgi:hypothetical protein